MADADVAAANVKWGEMMKAGNAKGLSELYTRDCRVLPPGGQPVNGREALQKMLQGFMDAGCKGATLTSDEIQPGADVTPEGGSFWERGNYKFFKEGDAILDEGKYVVIWKKVLGHIYLDIDIWNSNSQ